jgi:hypothetical protein
MTEKVNRRPGYWRFLYELYRARRRPSLDLQGTVLQRIQQLLIILGPYIIGFIQEGDIWILTARNRRGKLIVFRAPTRIECLIDLATVLGFKP